MTAAPLITLNEDNTPAIIQLIGRQCGIAMNAALRSVLRIAFPDSDRVEFMLSPTHSGRRLVEENRLRIEELLQRHSGQHVALAFRTEEASVSTADETSESHRESPSEAEPPPAGQVQEAAAATPRQFSSKPEQSGAQKSPDIVSEIDPLADRFVRQISEVFGGKVVKVTSAPDLNRMAGDDAALDDTMS